MGSEKAGQGCLQVEWIVDRDVQDKEEAEVDWRVSERWESRDHLAKKRPGHGSASGEKEWRGDDLLSVSGSGWEWMVGKRRTTWCLE